MGNEQVKKEKKSEIRIKEKEKRRDLR